MFGRRMQSCITMSLPHVELKTHLRKLCDFQLKKHTCKIDGQHSSRMTRPIARTLPWITKISVSLGHHAQLMIGRKEIHVASTQFKIGDFIYLALRGFKFEVQRLT